MTDSPAAAGCAGGGCSGTGAWASSCWAQRSPWRLETRLLTDVAVPAMTAVRAIPLRSPGILFLLLACGLGRVERGDDLVDRDPAGSDQLAARLADGGRERRRPGVLV